MLAVTNDKNNSNHGHGPSQDLKLHGFNFLMEKRKGKRSDGARSFFTTIYPIIFTVLPSILNIFGLPTTDILLAGFVIVYLYIILKGTIFTYIATGENLEIACRNSNLLRQSDRPELALYYSRVEIIALVIYLLTPLMGGMGLYYSQLLFQHKILNEFHVVVFVLASYIQPILHLQSIIKKYLISPIDVPVIAFNIDTRR